MLVGSERLKLLNTYSELQDWRKGINASVALVPTMGSLHEGHARLIKLAQKQCEQVIVSVFVNPLQFNDLQDFINYPRCVEHDCELLNQWGANAVYLPSESDMYPEGDAVIQENPGELGSLYEGAFRPGHFAGMLTVVKRLFERTRPHVAFFGEKDAQQLCLVEQLSKRIADGPKIVAVPTAREDSGLAMSSRNNRLSEQQRKSAAAIFGAMIQAQHQCQHESIGLASINRAMNDAMRRAGLEVEYALLVDHATFIPLSDEDLNQYRAGESLLPRVIVAAKLGDVRLIDNLLLSKN